MVVCCVLCAQLFGWIVASLVAHIMTMQTMQIRGMPSARLGLCAYLDVHRSVGSPRMFNLVLHCSSMVSLLSFSAQVICEELDARSC